MPRIGEPNKKYSLYLPTSLVDRLREIYPQHGGLSRITRQLVIRHVRRVNEHLAAKSAAAASTITLPSLHPNEILSEKELSDE